MSGTPYLDALERDGYVVIPNLLEKHMLLAQKAACKYVTDGARQGRWPFIRTVPKQYPPWPKWEKGDQHNIWGVQHLLHLDMTVRATFAELYFSDAILDVVKELVGLKNDEKADDKLVMELFNLLVSPADKQDFELCWHRDDVRPDVSSDEEARLLKEKSPEGGQLHAQYNIALFDDASLIVVPGSHRRIRTQIERDADLYEADLPGQLLVELKCGDARLLQQQHPTQRNLQRHRLEIGTRSHDFARLCWTGWSWNRTSSFKYCSMPLVNGWTVPTFPKWKVRRVKEPKQ